MLVFVDVKEYCKRCDIYQCIGKPCHIDELPLFPITTLDLFDKWAIEFVGPISTPECQTSVCYIIMTTQYLTRWSKVVPVKDCTA
jgi:hypothetical protein